METGVGTNSYTAQKIWSERFFREVNPISYLNKFMSEKGDNVVKVHTELTKDAGDEVRVPFVGRLVGPGVRGDNTLSGQEEELDIQGSTVVLDQVRNGVKSAGKLTEQRTVVDMPSTSREKLKQWMAEQMDRDAFTAWTANPTQLVYLDGSGNNTYTTSLATAVAGVTSATNSKIKLAVFPYLRTLCDTGRGRDFRPIDPVVVDGKRYRILLVHPDALHDLKQDSSWQQANRDAQERGKDNPIFTGAEAVYDGIIVHTHEFMPKALNGGGGSIPYVQGVVFGAQSLLFAWGKRPTPGMEETDHGNKTAWSISAIYGVKKPVISSRDFGSLGVVFARTNVSN